MGTRKNHKQHPPLVNPAMRHTKPLTRYMRPYNQREPGFGWPTEYTEAVQGARTPAMRPGMYLSGGSLWLGQGY